MHPTDNAFSHARARRGFNLVEAAIVLGVVGLVIGGVWVAANSVRTEMLSNQVHTGIMRAIQIVKETLTQRDVETINATNPNDINTSSRALLGGKLDGFSGNVLGQYGADIAIGTPLGNASYLYMTLAPAPSPSGARPIKLLMGGIPQSICYRLIYKIRSAIMADPSGNTIGALEGSSGTYLAAGWNNGTPRFDADASMCAGSSIVFQITFLVD